MSFNLKINDQFRRSLRKGGTSSRFFQPLLIQETSVLCVAMLVGEWRPPTTITLSPPLFHFKPSLSSTTTQRNPLQDSAGVELPYARSFADITCPHWHTTHGSLHSPGPPSLLLPLNFSCSLIKVGCLLTEIKMQNLFAKRLQWQVYPVSSKSLLCVHITGYVISDWETEILNIVLVLLLEKYTDFIQH